MVTDYEVKSGQYFRGAPIRQPIKYFSNLILLYSGFFSEFFYVNIFTLRGGGYPPIPLKQKTGISGKKLYS